MGKKSVFYVFHSILGISHEAFTMESAIYIHSNPMLDISHETFTMKYFDLPVSRSDHEKRHVLLLQSFYSTSLDCFCSP